MRCSGVGVGTVCEVAVGPGVMLQDLEIATIRYQLFLSTIAFYADDRTALKMSKLPRPKEVRQY